MSDDKIMGAKAIAYELGWSRTKFGLLSKKLQRDGILFKDYRTSAKHPYLWTWRSLLQNATIKNHKNSFLPTQISRIHNEDTLRLDLTFTFFYDNTKYQQALALKNKENFKKLADILGALME